MTASRQTWIMTAFFLLVFVPAALAGPARFATIEPAGATGTFALGINPAGDIVGAWDDKSGHEHGFLLHAGKFTSFDFPGATWTDAYGITPEGDIVGQYGRADNTTQGFMLRIGERSNRQCCEPGVTEVKVDDATPTLHFYAVEVAGPSDAGTPNSMPFGMSPDGTIVGCYHQGSKGAVPGTMHGFVLNADGAAFDPLANTMHTGINPLGDLTGYSTIDGRSYVMHSSDGSTEWFTVPNTASTRALGINASGDVVGWYKDKQAKFHGFLRHNGESVAIDADLPGVIRTTASGINSQGDIVGYYQDATGWHGFLLRQRSDE